MPQLYLRKTVFMQENINNDEIGFTFKSLARRQD